MRRKLFYLLMISQLLVISCNKEDGDPYDYHHPYGYMEGTFPDATAGQKLLLIYNGDTLTNKKITFVSRGRSEKPQAILTLENVIDGEAKTEIIADLVETVNPDNNGLIRLKFEGVYSAKSRSVTYSGYIEPLVLFLNLKE